MWNSDLFVKGATRVKALFIKGLVLFARSLELYLGNMLFHIQNS